MISDERGEGKVYAAGPRKAWAVILLAAAISTAGCAANSKLKPVVMAWPAPPEKPHIAFVRTLGSERDLHGQSSLKTAINFIIGRENEAWHLYQPLGLAVTDDGQRLYVSDYSQSFVYAFDLKNNKVEILGEQQALGRPVGLALDGSGRLYVADQQQRRILVFDASHRLLRSMHLAEVSRPTGIAIDRKRSLLYVADTSTNHSADHYVRVYDLNGKFLRNIGQGRGSKEGLLQFPTYVALDASGNVYVADTMNSRVSVFDPDGNFLRFYGGAGDRWGEMNKPKGVALDSFGNVYVVDSAWSVVQIFNQKAEVLLTFGGRHRFPGMFENPTGIVIDRHNRIYVADTFNHRVNVYDLVNTSATDSFVSVPASNQQGENRKGG